MNSPLKQEIDALKIELSVCQRKLESKGEALLILSKDLAQCRQERDQFKLMAEQVQQRYQALKRQLSGVGPRPSVSEADTTGMKQHNLQSLIWELQETNKALQFEVDDIKQKHKDAQGDIKLLREQIARQRVGTTDEGMTTRHFPAHEREDLVKQLEAAREQVEQLERDLQQVFDDKEEQETERDIYKNKYERLNTELNYILKGDENRILDIDALSMENKYLHERLKQMEEEKTMAMATVSKYKSILERKKNKGILKLGQNRSGGVVISQKQVQQLLDEGGSPTPQMLADLQSLSSALLESVNDKNLALSHQRKTNKILGERVAELEKKLKTLEVAGLWNISGGVSPGGSMEGSLDKLRLECDEIKTLHATSAVMAHVDRNNDDLDLLPTKEQPGAQMACSPIVSPLSSTSITMEEDLLSPSFDIKSHNKQVEQSRILSANDLENDIDEVFHDDDDDGDGVVVNDNGGVVVNDDNDVVVEEGEENEENKVGSEESGEDSEETALNKVDLSDMMAPGLEFEKEEREGEVDVERLERLVDAASAGLVGMARSEEEEEEEEDEDDEEFLLNKALDEPTEVSA